jgi:hypothetical protein
MQRSSNHTQARSLRNVRLLPAIVLLVEMLRRKRLHVVCAATLVLLYQHQGYCYKHLILHNITIEEHLTGLRAMSWCTVVYVVFVSF